MIAPLGMIAVPHAQWYEGFEDKGFTIVVGEDQDWAWKIYTEPTENLPITDGCVAMDISTYYHAVGGFSLVTIDGDRETIMPVVTALVDGLNEVDG